MTKKPYRFPTAKHAPRDPLVSRKPKVDDGNVEQPLTHLVQGEHASDLEERFSRALDKRGIEYHFQFITGAPKGMPGYNALDFLIYRGGWHPYQVDDTTFIHKGTEAHDRLVEVKTMRNLTNMGYDPFPIKRVTQEDLSKQDDADLFVTNTFG
jgi:hypothetical protein